MDTTPSEDRIRSIYKQLITSSKKLNTMSSEWNRICDDSQNCLRRINNLHEQLCSCRSVLMDSIPTSFPTSTCDRLIFKIQLAIGDELAQLTSYLKKLEQQLGYIKGVCQQVRTAYSDKWRDLSLHSLCNSNGVLPSIGSVLEYFEDVWRLFYVDFLCRKAALGMIDLTDDSSLADLRDRWKCGPLKDVDRRTTGIPSLHHVWKWATDNCNSVLLSPLL